MNKSVYKIVNMYLSEILFSELEKMKSKFVGDDVMCWKSGDNIVIMIDGGDIKLSGNIWYILTNHFSLNASDVQTIMVDWVKKNLGVDRKLRLGNCSYTRVMFN